MDPVTHSLAGAAVARAGLHRTTPLATATLVVAANAPDIDIAAYVGGTYAALAGRRGLTHGPLAMLLLPLLVAAAILLYDRLWRRRRGPALQPARPIVVLGLACIGVLTHSPLDWMNAYGIRLLMPFSQRWFYGDALFIIDPWLWLLLAVPVAGLAVSRRGRLGWVVLAIAATLLVMLAPQVPLAARVAWLLALAAVAARTVAGPVGEPAARLVLAGAVLYIAGMVAADRLARGAAASSAVAAGLDVVQLMAAPVPANPLAAELVAETGDAYHLGRLDWLASPRVRWTGTVPKGERTPPVLATLQLQEVRDFLRWSRFPYVEVREQGDGYVVRFGDARYPHGMRGGLSGVVVEVEGTLRAVPLP